MALPSSSAKKLTYGFVASSPPCKICRHVPLPLPRYKIRRHALSPCKIRQGHRGTLHLSFAVSTFERNQMGL
uniref:Uncharacterized protein n=1 Tax=Oryza rufipogon TaxID=4529 RepID=A0A0E0NXU4_ORYRU